MKVNSIILTEFHIKVTNIDQTAVTFVFSHEGNKWNTVKLNFWVSSRKDIILGAISSGTSIANISDFNNIRNQTVHTFVNFRNPVKNADKMVSRAFLNGIKVNPSNTNTLDVGVEARQTEEKRLPVKVRVGQNLELNTLWFSFIIFSPNEVEFASYGGGYSRQNFKGIQHYSVHRSIPGLKFPIYGLV